MVMNSFCIGYNNWKINRKTKPLEYEMWYESHIDECFINHTGSSGKIKMCEHIYVCKVVG